MDSTSMNYALTLFTSHLSDLRYSPRTITRYGRVLGEFRLFLADRFPSVDLSQVMTEHVILFLRQGRGSAASTQNVRLAALRVFFSFLASQGLVEKSPAAEIAFLSVRSREPTFLSHREYHRLLHAVIRSARSSQVVRNEAIVVALFNTGLRVSELASLSLTMLDFGTRAFRNVPLKGGGFGSVEWNRETERVLLTWLEVRRSWRVPSGVDALFVTEAGEPLSVRAIQHLVARSSRRARLGKRVTPHVLRHSMATELLRHGFDIRVIAGLLHHASLNTTKRYAHLTDALRRKALASLEPGDAPRRRPRRS